MKTANRKFVYNTHSPWNKPQIIVEPMEEFEVQTELCTGSWLNSLDDVYSSGKATGTNPTVVVGVNTAEPGDILAVQIISIVPDKLGYTGFFGNHQLAYRIKTMDWGAPTKTVEIKDGFVLWDDMIRIPIRPMIGTLGVAPANEALSNEKGGVYGGNMDAQEISVGSTVYFPVLTKQALIHIGDVHAIQGDGEINGAGGIECRSTVHLSADVIKNKKPLRGVRVENDDYIMTIACERSSDESFYTAAGALIEWMTEDYGYTYKDAYLILGQVMEARITQFVNPTSTYICKMPKTYLCRK